jgi:putative SOS response-associated peptidase YedK
MCSRYSLTSPPEAVRALFGIGPFEPFPPRLAIAPTDPVVIVRQGPRGVPELALVRWGLIPSWVKDPREFTTLFNARSETATEKPSFRGAMRHRRCLVPADAWIEWTGPKRARSRWRVGRRDHGLMAFAGLWEHWLGADGSEIETMTILTMAANATLAPLHERMPVILPATSFAAWLDCRPGSAVDAQHLVVPAPEDLLEAVPDSA